MSSNKMHILIRMERQADGTYIKCLLSPAVKQFSSFSMTGLVFYHFTLWHHSRNFYDYLGITWSSMSWWNMRSLFPKPTSFSSRVSAIIIMCSGMMKWCFTMHWTQWPMACTNWRNKCRMMFLLSQPLFFKIMCETSPRVQPTARGPRCIHQVRARRRTSLHFKHHGYFTK